jgi:hypothetical protein
MAIMISQVCCCAPQPDEIAVIVCLANRGRLNARVGGLSRADAKKQDGPRSP